MMKYKMKRLLSILLVVIMLSSVCFACKFEAFAADTVPTYTYELTVDGQTEKSVRTGDIITITLYLNRTDTNEYYSMYAMQDEIRYDSTFFEYVEGSELLARGIQTMHISVEGQYREVYLNFLSFSGGETWRVRKPIGSFQLRVIAESGVTQITSQDYLVALPDGSGSYACEANSLTIAMEGETLPGDSVGGDDTAEEPQDDENRLWILWIVLAVILFLVIEILLLWWFRKKKNDDTTPPDNGQDEEQPTAGDSAREEDATEDAGAEETEDIPDEVADVATTDGEDTSDQDAAVNDDEELTEEVITTEDGRRIIGKFNRSFIAKLIGAPEETKEFYALIKNYLLSFKGVNSRVSWKADAFHVGRKQVAKLLIKGKTLYVHLALDPAAYSDLKFKIIDKSESKLYAAIPLGFRVKSSRAVKCAMRLIDDVMNALGLERRDPVQKVDASDYPYEDTDALIAKGFIKVRADLDEQNTQADNTVSELSDSTTPLVEEDTADASDEDGESAFQYNRSFIARLIQAPEETKGFYVEIRNYLLSFKGVRCRISWQNVAFYAGRKQIARLTIKGKTLNVNLALNPADYTNLRFKVSDKSESKAYAAVPLGFKVRSNRGVIGTKKMIDDIAAANGLVGQVCTDVAAVGDYPYETTEALLEKGMIKAKPRL